MDMVFHFPSFIAGVLSVCAVFIGLRRWRGRRSAVPKGLTDVGAVTIPPDLHPQIRLLRAEGRVDQAIRIVRSRTRCSTAAAERAVQALR